MADIPPVDMAPLVDLCEALAAAGIPASLDPAEVNPPGAWVTLGGLAWDTLGGGHQYQASVYLVVPDLDHRRALTALATLYSTMLEVITPDGLVTTTGLVLPDNPTPLPSLLVPVLSA